MSLKTETFETKFGSFNPDAILDPREVDEIAQYFEANIEEVAESWFHHLGTHGGQMLVIRLWAYCQSKAAAMRCRLAGRIDHAQLFEQYCDELYLRLPDSIRW